MELKVVSEFEWKKTIKQGVEKWWVFSSVTTSRIKLCGESMPKNINRFGSGFLISKKRN